LGYLDDQGALYLNGRKSEMFKTGGENVFPLEVEQVLCEHPAVIMAAVIGAPDPLYQEVGHAFVMLRPGATVTAEELKAHCKERLANFKVPREYAIHAMLPLLPNGKVNKMELKRGIQSSA
jgi:acyl-CoA synthetase (AMP-forming)/AMP-acid ligase II